MFKLTLNASLLEVVSCGKINILSGDREYVGTPQSVYSSWVEVWVQRGVNMCAKCQDDPSRTCWDTYFILDQGGRLIDHQTDISILGVMLLSWLKVYAVILHSRHVASE